MSKASKKKKAVLEERYHGPLITNGVSLGYIKLLPSITLPVSFMAYFGTTYIDHIGIYKILFIVCMLISAVAIPLSFFDRFIVRFKSFIYLFVSVLVLILNVDMTFIGLIMLVGNDGIYSDLALAYNLVALCILLFSTGFYSWYYLPKNQGKIWAFNRWETYGGDDNDKKQERMFNVGVAFVVFNQNNFVRILKLSQRFEEGKISVICRADDDPDVYLEVRMGTDQEPIITELQKDENQVLK